MYVPVTESTIITLILYNMLQSVAVEGYETGEHAPGLRLRGTGGYRAAHHIIKVGECMYVQLSNYQLICHFELNANHIHNIFFIGTC